MANPTALDVSFPSLIEDELFVYVHTRKPDRVCLEWDVDTDDYACIDISLRQAQRLREWLNHALPDQKAALTSNPMNAWPEFDDFAREAMRDKARPNIANKTEAYGHMSDEWVANRVRMLGRNDLEFEPICSAGRDRIMRLSMEVAELRGILAARRADETKAPLPEGFTLYKRVGSILARPWTQQDAADYLNGIHTNVSVSDADKHTACVAQGMLAMNPANSYDCWYIAPTYFAKHYASDSPVKSGEEPLTVSKVPQ